jgi:predicted O-methyltransferase YrrM
MANITSYLLENGFTYTDFEGYSGQIPEQTVDLTKLTQSPSIKTILEIGFNAGHSSDTFLFANPTATVVSFDLGAHTYVKKAKEYIDRMYPGRHTLILGDSTVTIPEYITNNPGKPFDAIFVDGGHEYPIAYADLSNCFALAHNDTIVIVDDTVYTDTWQAGHTIGPTAAWENHIRMGRIVEIDGKDYLPYRGMSWGTYLKKRR